MSQFLRQPSTDLQAKLSEQGKWIAALVLDADASNTLGADRGRQLGLSRREFIEIVDRGDGSRCRIVVRWCEVISRPSLLAEECPLTTYERHSLPQCNRWSFVSAVAAVV